MTTLVDPPTPSGIHDGPAISGRHHGIEGFRELSNPRRVVVGGTEDLIDAFLPPYGAMAQAIVDHATSGGGPAAT